MVLKTSRGALFVFPLPIALMLATSMPALAVEDEQQTYFSSPAPESPPREEQASVARPGRDPRTPAFHYIRPAWSFELEGSLKAFGKTPGIPNLGTSDVRGLSMQFDWQPTFIQSYGILGLGPRITWYPVMPTGAAVYSLGGIFSAGGQVRYQLRFFREQPLVPVAGYAVEYVHYSLANGQSGGVTASGVFLGGQLLLNVFDPRGASEFFVNTGVLRSYIVAEYRTLTGSDANINLSGQSWFLGLRFEY
jgi:hypothetical protein